MIVSRAAGKTDPGRKRRRNEDSYVCDPPLFAVADGMGGAQAGEVASELAAGALRERDGIGDGERSVVELIQEANRRVWQRANEDAAASGMGTTTTVALVEASRVVFGHVGDSRAYLLREGELIQLTEDHSLVAELVRRGELSPQEAETHPQRSVITRALGTDPDVDVDTFAVEAEPQDLFLICSDGLSSMVADETVRELLERHRGDLDGAAKALVAAANRSGGEDNITVVLFEVAAGDEPAADTTQMAAVAPPEQPEPLHDEDEDTLTGIRAPTAVDTMVVPPEEAARLAAATRRPSLARRMLVLLLIVTLVLVIAALVLWGLAR
ncbi:MAG TPA: Stp1/IreP family PP2C-type Ser/Thr phosphatase [Gaiellaceae bacterium]|nr:Stp1/IreP family PP2C-type Ser/Thr phosphatase [Gaiellaceae bacterium]